MFTRREFLTKGLETAAFLAVASKFELKAAAFQGIPYERGLAQVSEIHGNPGRWEFIPSEPSRAARLIGDPNFNDTLISLDAKTVAEGYQLLVEPVEPNGFREQRIVVGPGQQEIFVKGILVRRDVFPADLYRFVLSKRTSDTVEEHRTRGTNHTVIGIDGFGGKGDLRDGFKPTRFRDEAEVALRYGGSPNDYELLEGGFAARFKTELQGHRLVFLDANTVLEGFQHLWSPESFREQRIVVGPGQNGIYVKNAVIRRDERPDVLYKYILGRKAADTSTENRQRGTNIPVIGVNGFRGGEK